jgi:hemerythrin-like metal-binding protein
MAFQLEWRDAFSVGHSGLDMEHRDLIARINEICSGEAIENIEHRIQSLVLFVKDHFEHESAALRKIIDGSLEITASAKTVSADAILDHIHDHEISLAKLRAIGQAIVDAGVNERNREALKLWFIDHAIRHDAHLKSVFQAL